LGDLVLTASSMTSRNFTLGVEIGRGQTVEAAAQAQRGIGEGMFTAGAVVRIAAAQAIDVPISQAVHCILQGKISVDRAIEMLMQRPLKIED
jgi:glycerol-3-phosphate dehydrogenase (NAD(P)+)